MEKRSVDYNEIIRYFKIKCKNLNIVEVWVVCSLVKKDIHKTRKKTGNFYWLSATDESCVMTFYRMGHQVEVFVLVLLFSLMTKDTKYLTPLTSY